ncbi:AAA family ATPase [uncultured Succinatimonas sp.]|uniref:AAA family ATPase n=2 Tax=Succinatimonas TaxID=674963 RepID=UPI0025CC24EC|nr:AAA family ATPase [uncultured Succinatimonas sp.]
MMIDYSKLPLSITSFSDFAVNSMIYVDKTDLVANLARFRNPIFLSRPRRFGKSTLVSTFHELFSNGLDKFQGLKITNENLWNDKTYKVIHIDFSQIKENTENRPFEDKFYLLLKSSFKEASLAIAEERDVIAAFADTIAAEENGTLVLLIDEYDAPLTAVMGDKEEFEARRALFSEFFSTVKSRSSKFRFIFITGVTRYSNTSIFSAFNNIKDISFNPTYGAIVGYTQAELENYFKDYIEYAANALNKKEKTDKYTYELILEELKNNYDGYSFDEECEWHVYNPWSILNFLSEPQRGFKPYWLETGGAKPSLLVNYLNTFIDKKVKKTELVDYLNLEFIKRTNIAALSPTITSIEDENFPFFAILYQAGYFTIKDTDAPDLMVGIPNLEVKEAFADIVLEKLTNKDGTALRESYKQVIRSALNSKDFKTLKDEFNKILNEFSYESVISFKEYAFRDVYKVMLQLLGYNTYTEYQTALGRSDLCFEDDEHLYICEFKVISKADNVQEKLAKAKEQIREKKYGLRITDKEVITLAIVIVNENKDDTHTPMREVAAIEEA